MVDIVGDGIITDRHRHRYEGESTRFRYAEADLSDRRRVSQPRVNLYPVGTTVYHDDYGSGVVSESRHSGGELVVEVHFESGRIARFLPKYVALEKVEHDA